MFPTKAFEDFHQKYLQQVTDIVYAETKLLRIKCPKKKKKIVTDFKKQKNSISQLKLIRHIKHG